MEDKLATDAPQPRSSKWFALRIATSVFFAVLAVALLVLWVRSYYWHDLAIAPITTTTAFRISSFRGRVIFDNLPPRSSRTWIWRADDLGAAEQWRQQDAESKWAWRSLPQPRRTHVTIAFPIWSVTLVAVSLTTLSWLSKAKRFSLRTLLIATTLVAVVLGLVCYIVR